VRRYLTRIAAYSAHINPVLLEAFQDEITDPIAAESSEIGGFGT
jgi:hypothetical protein